MKLFNGILILLGIANIFVTVHMLHNGHAYTKWDVILDTLVTWNMVVAMIDTVAEKINPSED